MTNIEEQELKQIAKQAIENTELLFKAQMFLVSADILIKTISTDSEYHKGFRDCLRFCKSCLDGEAPHYEEAKK